MKKTVSILIAVVGIMLALISISLNISNLTVTDESIVLVFVGILATLVVVGNYAQVLEIQNNTKTQIQDLKTETQTEFKKLEEMQEQVSIKIQELDKIQLNIANISKDIENKESRILELEKSIRNQTVEHYVHIGDYLIFTKSFRTSTGYFIEALKTMFDCNQDYDDNFANVIMDAILINLDDNQWASDDVRFNYDKYVGNILLFPDSYEKRDEILDELTRQKDIYEPQKMN